MRILVWKIHCMMIEIPSDNIWYLWCSNSRYWILLFFSLFTVVLFSVISLCLSNPVSFPPLSQCQHRRRFPGIYWFCKSTRFSFHFIKCIYFCLITLPITEASAFGGDFLKDRAFNFGENGQISNDRINILEALV